MVDNRDKLYKRLQYIDQHKQMVIYLVVGIYLFLNNTINATTTWMEYSRNSTPPFQLWEPFVWEYSSALSTLLLFPILLTLFGRLPLLFANIKRQIVIHIVASIMFSVSHVVLMVLFRKGVYFLNGGQYQFGNWPRELWYEYQKDVWGYVLLFVSFHLVRFAYSRIKGEASQISEEVLSEETSAPTQVPKHFIVKKLDREFLIRAEDIEWLESSGNYVNLHSKGRIFPLRGTLTKLLSQLEPLGFSRIHRSFGINHSSIESISYHHSGDGEITTHSKHTLPLSRRYKEQLKQSLE